jgi:hypothetical protein
MMSSDSFVSAANAIDGIMVIISAAASRMENMPFVLCFFMVFPSHFRIISYYKKGTSAFLLSARGAFRPGRRF